MRYLAANDTQLNRPFGAAFSPHENLHGKNPLGDLGQALRQFEARPLRPFLLFPGAFLFLAVTGEDSQVIGLNVDPLPLQESCNVCVAQPLVQHPLAEGGDVVHVLERTLSCGQRKVKKIFSSSQRFDRQANDPGSCAGDAQKIEAEGDWQEVSRG